MINAKEINRLIKNVYLFCRERVGCERCPLAGKNERSENCRWASGDMTQGEVDMIAAFDPPVDWSKVPVDAKVVVWNNVGMEHRRYFAKYENGKIYTYLNGATSWSKESDNLVKWQYGRLAEDE